MNPARSLGPALVTYKLTHLWLYLAAPVLGAALGVLPAVASGNPIAAGQILTGRPA